MRFSFKTKNTIILLHLVVLCFLTGNSQTIAIQKNEILQIFDKFLSDSNLQTHISGQNVFVVKILKETGTVSYSVAISTVAFRRELPEKVNYCFIFENKCFFLIKENTFSIDSSEIETTIFISDKSKINRIAESAGFYKGGGFIMSYPTIVLYRIEKENWLFKTRKVRFETYHPIDNLPKYYWPIENFVNAITDEPFPEYTEFINRKVKTNLKHKTFLENGKGKFRIRTK